MSNGAHVPGASPVAGIEVSEQFMTERRASVRYRCHVKMLAGGPSWPAPIHNISREGVGFFLGRNLDIGSVVTVEVQNLASSFWHLKAVRVVHTTPHQGGDWLIGTAFLQPLLETELQDLLKTD